MYKILVLEPEYFDKEVIKLLGKVGKVNVKRLTRRQLEAEIVDTDVLVVRIEDHIDKNILSRAKKLKVIGSATTGLDHIDVKYAKSKGIEIISLHGTHTVPAAEHTLALMLSLARKIPWAHRSMSHGHWRRHRFIGMQMEGKTLGIVGLGRIGSRVAGYANALGMHVLYDDPSTPSSKLGTKVSLEKLLKNSDIVSLNDSLTNTSLHEIGYREFKMMKKSALLVNTARAEVIDHGALLKALENGVISGAAVDVFPKEPLHDKNAPIVKYARTHSNLILTPHIAATTVDAVHEAGMEIAKGIAKYLK